MFCNNVKCKHYRRPDKCTYLEKRCGVTSKQGGCKYSYCKLNNRWH